MLDTTFIQTLHKKNEVFRKKKEYILTKLKKNIIDLERQPGEILKLSKESINHCIYERVNKAQKSLGKAEKLIQKCDKQISILKGKVSVEVIASTLQLKDLQNLKFDQLENSLTKAKEEFLEAKILFHFNKGGKLYKPHTKNLKDFNNYMGGLSDFCGELLRKLRVNIIKSNITDNTFEKYLSLMNRIHEELSKYSFTNASSNRPKIEHLKGYIIEVEKMRYEQKYHADPSVSNPSLE